MSQINLRGSTFFDWKIARSRCSRLWSYPIRRCGWVRSVVCISPTKRCLITSNTMARGDSVAVPRFRLNTYGHRAFSVAGPMAWNSLPDFILDPTSSTDCFRRLFKTYLLARYVNGVTSASRAVGVLNDYALYKSTHSLTHSLTHS